MANSVGSTVKTGFYYGAAGALSSFIVNKACEYVTKEIASDDPFGLSTGGKTARAYNSVKKYVQEEMHSDDPFGLKTGGKTVRVLRGEERCVIL